MPTVLLIRHGRTAANAGGTLAGWTPGVVLDETGRAQAQRLTERLAPVPVVAAVTSPLERCQETAQIVLSGAGPRIGRRQVPRPVPEVDERLGECRYGDWTNRPLKELVKEPLWRVVQAHPSAVTFPGPEGEPMLGMQQRAVTAIREHDRKVAERHGPDAVWAVFSHGDVIKSILADALGMHLDAFQRIVVDPCSVSVVRYTELRPFAVRTNDSGGDLAFLAARPTRSRRSRAGTGSDAAVGGGAGEGPPDRAVAAAGQ